MAVLFARAALTTVLIIISTSTSLVAYSAPLQHLDVNAADRQFVVTLPANATTGYRWSVTHYDHSRLTLVNTQYIASSPHLMGSGGETRFTFARVKEQPDTQSARIRFKYARPWEHQSGKIQTVQVHFVTARTSPRTQ